MAWKAAFALLVFSLWAIKSNLAGRLYFVRSDLAMLDPLAEEETQVPNRSVDNPADAIKGNLFRRS